MALPGLVTTTYTIVCDDKGQFKQQTSEERMTRKPSPPPDQFSFESLLQKIIKSTLIRTRSKTLKPAISPASKPLHVSLSPTTHSSRVEVQIPVPRTSGSPRKRPFSKLNAVIKDCSDVQESLMPIWHRANTTLSGKRKQLSETKEVLEKATEESHNLWKSNEAYRTGKEHLEKRLKAQESVADQEAQELLSHLLGLRSDLSPPSSPDLSSVRSLHVAQMLRMHKRGFGQSFADRASAPVSPVRPARERPWFKHETDEEGLLREIKEYRLAELKAKTPVEFLFPVSKSEFPSPKNEEVVILKPGNELNEFIWRERGKYHSKSISDLNKKKRMMLEAKMERIAPSPDVLRKAKLLMAKEHQKRPLKASRIDNLQRKPFSKLSVKKPLQAGNPDEEMLQNSLKEKSVLERFFQKSNKKQEIAHTLRRMGA
jgi:hypothetical protein